jgi:hypothetical protein
MVSMPKPPAEDPEAKRRRDEMERRAESERILSIQEQLRGETDRRSGAFGLRSLLGPLGGGRSLRSLLGSG